MSAIFDWARPDNVQPEPITVEIWRQLPADFCRLVEVVNGDAVRCESPSRAHQKAVHRLMSMLEAAARDHMAQDPSVCIDVNHDFDVVLWEFPRATIRRPDIALFECVPSEVRPVPARHLDIAVEVISPSHVKTDRLEKMSEYAAAGIPWYWLVSVSDTEVTSIETFGLDHGVGHYRPGEILKPGTGFAVDLPIRIRIDWARLTDLVL
ncbi:Uma2 family endonuclease [Nocardia flavorosea]|uniref:Uma2 family endonuclease n=1 Tax=Nocardia flavorosea TaxID=53429 RepID=UPI0018942C26|nr:Uma2 family endonuclease [Nocardia flavorosea]MBF6352307.1 Uma2 family endonuclease [Nocardia flavorosea]